MKPDDLIFEKSLDIRIVPCESKPLSCSWIGGMMVNIYRKIDFVDKCVSVSRLCVNKNKLSFLNWFDPHFLYLH